MYRPLQFNAKGWLVEDPRGGQVIYAVSASRTLLGDVTDAYFDEVTGTQRLKVKHFNGEAWPLDPPAWSVQLMERDVDEATVETVNGDTEGGAA